MRFFVPAVLVLFLLLLPVGSMADNPTVIEFRGFSWETGGFPQSNSGDEMEMVAYVDHVAIPLSWDPVLYQYTIYMHSLLSQGQVVLDPYNIEVEYSGGLLGVYEDVVSSGTPALPGINPPNQTVPSTYVDGTNYLRATLSSFKITYNVQFNTGAFESDLTFIGGSHLSELGPQVTGFTFGGLYTFGTPTGYDLQWDGFILLDTTPVQPTTWHAVKAHFVR